MTCGTGGRIDSAIGTLTETINSVTAGSADVVLITTSSCVRKDRDIGIGVLIDAVSKIRQERSARLAKSIWRMHHEVKCFIETISWSGWCAWLERNLPGSRPGSKKMGGSPASQQDRRL